MKRSIFTLSTEEKRNGRTFATDLLNIPKTKRYFMNLILIREKE